MNKCSIEGCDRKHYGLGYCNRHYTQIKRTGKILKNNYKKLNEIIIKDTHAEIILYNRKYIEVGKVLIDLEDVEKIKQHKWSLDGCGYPSTHINKKTFRLYRILINSKENKVIDHKNHNKFDNQKENLRNISHSKNIFNQKIKKNSISGAIGVYWNKNLKKWVSSIKINYKEIYLGSFDILEEAKEVRLKAELKYFGENPNRGIEV